MLQYRELEHTLTNAAYVVVINTWPHEGPGYQERLGSIHPVLIEHGLSVGGLDQVPDQPLGIHRAVRGTGIIGVTKQVVHPVNIEIPVDDTREPVLSLHELTKFFRIDTGFLEQRAGPMADDPSYIIVSCVEELFHQGFAGMGERAMADIMEEPGSDHKHAVYFRKPEAAGCHVREEHGSERVLEPRVVGTGIHQKGKTELPDITEPLQGGRIKQGEGKVLHFNVTVDRVLDDFHRFTKESSYIEHKSIE
jgi:hypothetical protein